MSSFCSRASKHCKTRVLLKDPPVSRHIPQTVLLTKSNLPRMINKYATVYMKPDIGSAGRGICRIEREDRGQYILRGQGRVLARGDVRAIKQKARKLADRRIYLLQQGIRSVTHGGRPFDLRIHVQRVKGNWVIGGIVGKLGRRKSVVTNRHRGGKPTEIEHLLNHHLQWGASKRKSVLAGIERVSLRAARLLERRFPSLREYGIDIGIDEKEFWIYEVNTAPGIVVFSRLRDKRPLRRILLNRKRRK